jgi:electron transport complex protein RnfD
MEKLAVSGRPYVQGTTDTRRVMIDILIALIPAAEAAVVLYGLKALAIIAVCVASAMLSEFFFNKIAKKPQTAFDLSSAVTGLLLALSLPTKATLWQCLVGTVFAIVIVKCAFGGLGYNFANPAVTARVMLIIAFGTSVVRSVPEVSVVDKIFGYAAEGAAIGATSAFALVLGAIYLLARRVISWEAPVVYVAGTFLLSLALGGSFGAALDSILGGALLLGAIFMATDPVTTPKKSLGKAIFAFCCALLTVLIWNFGKYADGVVFAILFMNILTPYIDKLTDKIFAKKTVEAVEAATVTEEVAE